MHKISVDISKLKILDLIDKDELLCFLHLVDEVGVVIDDRNFLKQVFELSPKKDLFKETIDDNLFFTFMDEISNIISKQITKNSLSYEPLSLDFTMLSEKEISGIELSDDQELLLAKLKLLLENRTLINRIKCIHEMRENHHSFSKVSITPDIRLLLERKLSNGNGIEQFFGFLHQLKLSYIEDGQLKEFFISLDQIDFDYMINELTSHNRHSKKLQSELGKTINFVKM